MQEQITNLEKALGNKVHPFSSTLGPGPYKYVGMGQIHFSSTFGAKYVGPAIERGAGTCAHCGTAIIYIYAVQTGEGRVFGVGSDCIFKVQDNSGFENIPEVERQVKKLRNAQARERRKRQVENLRIECLALIETHKEKLLTLNYKNCRASYIASYYPSAYDAATAYLKIGRTLNAYKIYKKKILDWIAYEVK